MKHKFLYIAMLSGLIAFSSCDDFLTHDLEDGYNNDTFYKTEGDALKSINGAYNALSFTSAQNRLWVFGDVASDDAVKGGSDGDGSEISAIDDFSANSSNGMISEYWQHTYEAVNRANEVLKYVPGISMDETLKKRILAEAKFIRAYSYFKLTNIWGRIPLREEPIDKPSNLHVPLSDVSVVYALIEKDLKEAVTGLDKSYTGADAGRVTKGAAWGMLAKAYLYQKKYDDCLSAIDSLESLGVYSLTDNYADLFKMGAEDNAEVIFAIRHLSNQNPGLGNVLNVWLAPQQESGYYFDAPTQSYVDCFDEKTTDNADDPRLDASIGRDGKPWMNGSTFSASWSSTGYLVRKHQQPFSEVEQGRKSDGNLPYIYIRYADILLMKAEALNENNKTSLAQIEINKVRNRAKLANINTSDQNTMRVAIQKERRRELGFEFHRFFDLMRWGKDVAEAALGSKFTWQEPRFYFPIPQAEKDSNNAIN